MWHLFLRTVCQGTRLWQSFVRAARPLRQIFSFFALSFDSVVFRLLESSDGTTLHDTCLCWIGLQSCWWSKPNTLPSPTHLLHLDCWWDIEAICLDWSWELQLWDLASRRFQESPAPSQGTRLVLAVAYKRKSTRTAWQLAWLCLKCSGVPGVRAFRPHCSSSSWICSVAG